MRKLLAIVTIAAFALIVVPAASAQLFVKNGGNVGIGPDFETENPVQPLHIKKDGNVTFKFESNTAGGGVGWNFKINANGAFSISKVGTSGAELLLFDADSSKTLDIKGPIEATSFDVASSREVKTGFELLDPETALSKIAEMPISRWQYKDDPMGAVHIGPMAEDFHAAFETGSGESISLTDANGVALAAIQGLLERIEKLEQALAER